MKTKLEIINETAAYYSEDPSRRAISNGNCVYFDPDTGNMCAVGRCLNKPSDFKNNKGRSCSLINSEGYGIFKEDYKIMDSIFWHSLQNFHDSKRNWDEKGLTPFGKQHLEFLRHTYANE